MKVAQILHDLDYSLQSNRKTLEVSITPTAMRSLAQSTSSQEMLGQGIRSFRSTPRRGN